jgi:hypothetical protein
MQGWRHSTANAVRDATGRTVGCTDPSGTVFEVGGTVPHHATGDPVQCGAFVEVFVLVDQDLRVG